MGGSRKFSQAYGHHLCKSSFGFLFIYTNGGAISKSSCAFMVCKVKWVSNIFFIVTEEPLASGAIMSCSFCK